MNFQNIITALVIILVVGIVAVWFVYFRGSSDSVIVSVTTTKETLFENLEIATLLAKLRVVKLDTSFFSHPVYKSLVDPRVNIATPFEYGRRNPFAPIGEDVGLPLLDFETLLLPVLDEESSLPLSDEEGFPEGEIIP